MELYAPHLPPGTADSLRSMVRCGEPGLAVEDLASALVLRKVRLKAGDGVEFRRLLTGFERCPDTPVDVEDLLLFGEDPDGYSWYFMDQVSPFAVADAVVDRFPVPADRVGVVVDGVPSPGTPDRPAVLIERSADSGVEFFAGAEFSQLVGGASLLVVARALCLATGASAMLSAYGLTPDEWVLVTGEGGHGVVMVDDEASVEGRWEIEFAYEAIAGAPDLPVRPLR